MYYSGRSVFPLLIVLLFFVENIFANKTVLYIGGLYQSVTIAGVNEEMQYGTKQALEFVNKNPDILPEYQLMMIENFTSVDETTMTGDGLSILYDFIYEKPQLLMLIVSSNSLVAQPVCEAASHYNLIQMSGMASSPDLSDRERYPLFTRLYPSDTILVNGWEALLRTFQWKRVAIILENVETFSRLLKELILLFEEYGGHDILTVEQVQHGQDPSVQIESLKEQDARIIILLAHEEMARQITCQAYRANLYGPKYVWMLTGWLKADWHLQRTGQNDVTCSDTEMTSVLNGYFSIKVLSYSQEFKKVDFNGVKPSQEDLDFYSNIKSTYLFAGYGYDTIVYAALALNQSEKVLSRLDPPRQLMDFTYEDAVMANYLKESAQRLEMHGLTGKIEFTETGDRITDLIIEQMQDSQMVQVGIYDVGNDTFRWSEDTPLRWQGNLPPTDGVQTVYLPALPSNPVRILMFTLAGFGISFAIVCLVLNFVFRDKKVIKISSPLLNYFIAIGCIFLYILIIMFGLDTPKSESIGSYIFCHGRPLLVSVGVNLSFGALFMKTYRVYAIFKIAMEKFGEIRVGDTRLVVAILVMVAVDIIIILGWVTFDPCKIISVVVETQEVTDENGHDFLYVYQSRNCASKYAWFFTSGLSLYKAIVIFMGVFLAWQIRDVQVTVLNESRQIVLSVYVVALMFIINPLGTYFLSKLTLIYVINGTGIFTSNTLVLSLAFVPKIIALIRNPHNVNTSMMRSTKNGRSKSDNSEKSGTVGILRNKLISKLQDLAFLKKSYCRLRNELKPGDHPRTAAIGM
ncbi:gamma-aminobutyric acid type B receptor subunit 2-like [Ptychodera flava]|uniref:gamma-aminobutyric acid type B receptor subunit 2-like n=1 Tax=Ptychodera flava TaxID=63121 RepID=UPI00396A472D